MVMSPNSGPAVWQRNRLPQGPVTATWSPASRHLKRVPFNSDSTPAKRFFKASRSERTRPMQPGIFWMPRVGRWNCWPPTLTHMLFKPTFM